MTERTFRLILGSFLWLALVLAAILETMVPVYAVIALMLFEGVTNWRVPVVITRLRYGKNHEEHPECATCSKKWFGKVEAERMLRFIVPVFVMLPIVLSPDLIWFMPWFVAGMLILAGITNICPMVMFLRWVGLR